MDNVLSLYFNNRRCEEMGIYLYDIPSISVSNRDYTSQAIAGKLGYLITDNESIDNISIKCTFGILNKHSHHVFRAIKKWLTGKGNLYLTETPDSFYEVVYVKRGDIERELQCFSIFTVEFICFPYEFALTGKERYKAVDGNLTNPHDQCMPEYIISGEGVCTLTVNGNDIVANIGQNLTIDTRRLIAYRTDSGENMNTDVTGDYTLLWLKEGKNSISITNDFDLDIIPHWGWKA